MRPRDILPEVWSGMMSPEERKGHWQRWTTDRVPKIEAATTLRQRNGLAILRSDEDLQEQLHHDDPTDKHTKVGCVLTADNRLVASRAFARKDASEAPPAAATIPRTTAMGPESDESESEEAESLVHDSRCLICHKVRWCEDYN